jgi:sulfonate transport system substrate-binding protein
MGATAALTACGQPGSRPMTLVLGDQAGLTRARVEAAGTLAGALYAFKWANFQGAAPLFEALNAGAVDTAPAGDSPVIAAAAVGAPFKVVAASRSSGRGVAILVPPGSPIRRVRDLAGRLVVVSSARGSVAQYLLIEALREAGVPEDAVKVSFMLPHDAAGAFDGGRIDAWATFGTYQAVAEHRGARVLRDGRGLNTGIALVAVADKTLADPRRRAAVSDVIGRFARAGAWAHDRRGAYAQVFADHTGLPLDVARSIVEREDPRLGPVTPQLVSELQKVADLFAARGVFPKRVEVASLVDRTVFKPA